jgi:hypothetical protein
VAVSGKFWISGAESGLQLHRDGHVGIDLENERRRDLEQADVEALRAAHSDKPGFGKRDESFDPLE